jgi:uncharacterized protein (TIGR03083 family)
VEPGEYVTALRREGALLAGAAERAGLEAPVRACPGWTVADLVWHVGEVHDFWRRVVEQRATDRSEVPRSLERPPDTGLVAWYRDGLERLAGVLAATDPSTPVWSWTPEKHAGWVRRRVAQETVVHRADAELAGGAASPVDPALAVDGIDEFLQFWTPDKAKDAAPLDGSVHLHATDAEGEWLVTATGDRLQTTRGHAKGDAAARGAAGDLLLMLWRRGHGEVEVHGDQAVLDRFLAHTDLD